MTKELYDFLNPERLIPFHLLEELLVYEPETGILRWNVDHFGTIKKGRIAGTTAKSGPTKGYVVIELSQKAYKAHRLAWALYYKEYPDKNLVIDHKNGIRNDNRIDNLILTTHRKNAQNRKSRRYDLPVYVYNKRDKFSVTIKTDKVRAYGSFKTIEEAVAKRDEVLKSFRIELPDHLQKPFGVQVAE